MKITIDINQKEVFNEVAMQSSYEGAYTPTETGNAYLSVFTTEEHQEKLERFWKEACSEITTLLAPYAITSTIQNSGVYPVIITYHSELEISEWFPVETQTFLRSEICSYIELMILSKWYDITDKAKVESTALQAQAKYDSVDRLLSDRRRPKLTIDYNGI